MREIRTYGLNGGLTFAADSFNLDVKEARSTYVALSRPQANQNGERRRLRPTRPVRRRRSCALLGHEPRRRRNGDPPRNLRRPRRRSRGSKRAAPSSRKPTTSSPRPTNPGGRWGPKGQRRYVTPQGFTSLGGGASVRRFTVEGDSERAAAAAKTRRPKPERRADLGALRALVIDRFFSLRSVRPAHGLDEHVVRRAGEAGLDLEPMAGASAKTPAVRSTGPYSKAALAAFRASPPPELLTCALRLRRPTDQARR